MTTLVELCAGTASVSLAALAGRPVQPLTGYMGSKRRWARQIVEVLGYGERRPDRVVLVDAGPWGDTWRTLLDREQRRRVAELLRTAEASPGFAPGLLWARLVQMPPAEDPAERAMQFLWLQARSAGTIPIWWSPSGARWESPSGARTEKAHERGRRMGPAYEAEPKRAKPSQVDASVPAAHDPNEGDRYSRGARGVQYPSTIAERIDALDRLPWDRVEVVHGDLRDVEPIADSDVYYDPPYLNCPRYAATCPRRDVLAVALRHAAAGARVVVSEGAPLPLEGWHHARLHAERTSAGGGGALHA